MVASLNCLLLGKTSFDDAFAINVADFNEINRVNVKINDLKISDLKFLIWHRKKDTLGIDDPDIMKLWKVDVAESGEDKLKEFKEDENNKVVGAKFLRPISMFNECFKELTQGNIHVIVQVPAAGPSKQGVLQDVVDWDNNDSVYNWIRKLKRPSNSKKPALVSSFGANFPLQGRDETLQVLLNGTESRNGIRQRLKYIRENEYDKQLHHIPTLANGPGTGKSRFLQDLPTLLLNTNAGELHNLRMLFINLTFNGNTNTLEKEISAGEASVALRILYDHFIAGGAKSYGQFSSMCNGNWRNFTIVSALDVVIRDVGEDIDLIVLGIDELNCLHSLASSKTSVDNPVQKIVRSVGSLSTTLGKIIYVPILAGTIQGPLEKMIKESTYKILRLPLRLLSNTEVTSISSHMEDKLKEYIDLNNKTFQRCVSDLGGQVRAVEFFYDFLLKAVRSNPLYTVDYIYILKRVKAELLEQYPFIEVVASMKRVVARCILNIPVNKDSEIEDDKDDKTEKGDKNDKTKEGETYVGLSSKGIINLEEIPHHSDMKCYVRMPYMWVWIFTSLKGFEEGKFWDVMIDQESHVLWQDFEDFNMRYWVLRLQLFKVLYKTVTLRDLFNGAYYNDQGISLLDHKFQLPTMEKYYVELGYQYPHKMQSEHLSPGTVFKNGEGAPYDIFFFLDDYLIAIQGKSSNVTAGRPQTLSKGLVDKEYNKVKDAFEVMKKSFKSESPIKHWVLFICTNGPKTADCLESLPENCFVVYRENFKDFYGNTFSTRAEFAADNDQLDANIAEEHELKTIRGIGKKIASDIKNKRPFEDENDLYNKVKNIPVEARKKIKVTKINCK